MFSRMSITKSAKRFSTQIEKLEDAIALSDAIVVGTGAGLSISAGFVSARKHLRINP
mgnify:CR=1 FL=1